MLAPLTLAIVEVRRPFVYARAVLTMKSLQLVSLILKCYCCSPVTQFLVLFRKLQLISYHPDKGIFTLTHQAGLHQKHPPRVVWHHQIRSLLFCCGIQWGEVALHLDNRWRLAWTQPIVPSTTSQILRKCPSLNGTQCPLMSLNATYFLLI